LFKSAELAVLLSSTDSHYSTDQRLATDKLSFHVATPIEYLENKTNTFSIVMSRTFLNLTSWNCWCLEYP